MYFVFEHGPREGLAACELYYDVLMMSGVEDGESVVESEIGFTGGVLAEVSRTTEHPEPTERVRREARPEETLSEWYGAEGGDLGLDGYFTTSGGRILAPKVPIGRLGLEGMVEVVYHGRLRGGGFGKVVREGAVGTGRVQFPENGLALRAGLRGAGQLNTPVISVERPETIQ